MSTEKNSRIKRANAKSNRTLCIFLSSFNRLLPLQCVAAGLGFGRKTCRNLGRQVHGKQNNWHSA